MPRGAKSRMRRNETPHLNLDKILHGGRYIRRNHLHKLWWPSVKGFRGFGVLGGQNSPSPIDFHRRPYNTLALRCERVMVLEAFGVHIAKEILISSSVFATFTVESHRQIRTRPRPWCPPQRRCELDSRQLKTVAADRKFEVWTRSERQETKVCRYNWHSVCSLYWPFPTIKYKYTVSQKNKTPNSCP